MFCDTGKSYEIQVSATANKMLSGHSYTRPFTYSLRQPFGAEKAELYPGGSGVAALANSPLYPTATLVFVLGPDVAEPVLMAALKRMAAHTRALAQ